MAFGNVVEDTSATTTLTISNSGNSTLTWSGLSTGDGVFTASATSGTVAAGGSTSVTLTFTPAAATSYGSTLTVTSDATSGTNTTTLSGTGTAAPATRIMRVEWETPIPNTVVGQRGYGSVRLHNDGNSVMSCEQTSASNAAIVAFNSWSFPDPSNRDLLAGESATFSAEFIPTAAATYTGTVTIGCANATSGSGELSYTAIGTAAP